MLSARDRAFDPGPKSRLEKEDMIMRAILDAAVVAATLLGAAPAAVALDDPTITCNQTNDPWGSKELCYTGPIVPQSTTRAQSHRNPSTTGSAANARAQANHQ